MAGEVVTGAYAAGSCPVHLLFLCLKIFFSGEQTCISVHPAGGQGMQSLFGGGGAGDAILVWRGGQGSKSLLEGKGGGGGVSPHSLIRPISSLSDSLSSYPTLLSQLLSQYHSGALPLVALKGAAAGGATEAFNFLPFLICDVLFVHAYFLRCSHHLGGMCSACAARALRALYINLSSGAHSLFHFISFGTSRGYMGRTLSGVSKLC